MQRIGVEALHAWLEDAGRVSPGILDVREAWETALCSLPDAVLLPLSQGVGALEQLPQDREWVVVCHHGMRSFQVAMIMERSGFPRVYNLEGGIDAWARSVDPSMARY
jgi:rhodanese-related sulfurtransferase